MKSIPLLIVLAVLLSATPGGIVASEIHNPSVTYRKLPRPEGGADSVWTGSAFFEPLPEYMKETTVIVKCVSYKDCDNDILFWCNRQSYNRHEIELEPREARVPGPFKAGDTVTAEFTIKPLRVGTYDFGFQARTVSPGDEPGTSRGIGSIDAPFVIGPYGNVTAMNSQQVDYRCASDLGPTPDLFQERGAVFFIDPSPYFERMDPASTSHFWSNPYHVFHAVVWVSASTEKPNSLDLRISASPYRDYPGGIGLEINHTDGLQLTDLTPSIPGPIQAGQDYEFSLSVNYTDAGIHALSLFLATRNPDFGAPGDRQTKSLNEMTGSHVTLRIGVGNDGRLLFVTNVPPGQSLEQRTSVSAESIDSRYGFVRAADKKLKCDRKTTSLGFDQAIGIEKE